MQELYPSIDVLNIVGTVDRRSIFPSWTDILNIEEENYLLDSAGYQIVDKNGFDITI